MTLEISKEAATITLNSPQTRNALSTELIAELSDALDEASQAESRVIVLTHVPPVFCAGLDLKQIIDGLVDLSGLADVIRILHNVRQPTIAVLDGAVRAGGLGIMATCDLVVVAPSVTFAFTEVRVGVAPALISVPILTRVLWSHVASAFLTGDEFDAQRALSIGLVTHVAHDPQDKARQLVRSICEAGPKAVMATTRILRRAANEAFTTSLDEMRSLSEKIFSSAEAQEGLAAYSERRDPQWNLSS